MYASTGASAATPSLYVAIQGVTVLTDATSLQTNSSQYFSQTGLSGEDAKIVNGGGVLPLPSLMKILVPSGWEVHGSGKFDSVKAQWRGGLSWSQILYQVANKEKIFIGIDWVAKTVTVNVPDGSGISELAKPASKTNGKPAAEEKLAKNTQKQSAGTSTQNAKTNQNGPTIVKAKTVSINAEKLKEKPQYAGVKADDTNKKIAAQAEKTKTESIIAKTKADEDRIKTLERQREEAELQAKILAAKLKETQAEADRIKAENGISITKGATGPVKTVPELLADYQSRTVLPFDKSFDYFKSGGYKDTFGVDTPATFVAKKGTVEQVIKAWADVMHYDVDYRAETIYDNEYEISFQGTFQEATTEFIKLFQNSERPLKIQYFDNVKASPTGQGLIIISDRKIKDANSR